MKTQGDNEYCFLNHPNEVVEKTEKWENTCRQLFRGIAIRIIGERKLLIRSVCYQGRRWEHSVQFIEDPKERPCCEIVVLEGLDETRIRELEEQSTHLCEIIRQTLLRVEIDKDIERDLLNLENFNCNEPVGEIYAHRVRRIHTCYDKVAHAIQERNDNGMSLSLYNKLYAQCLKSSRYLENLLPDVEDETFGYTMSRLVTYRARRVMNIRKRLMQYDYSDYYAALYRENHANPQMLAQAILEECDDPYVVRVMIQEQCVYDHLTQRINRMSTTVQTRRTSIHVKTLNMQVETFYNNGVVNDHSIINKSA